MSSSSLAIDPLLVFGEDAPTDCAAQGGRGADGSGARAARTAARGHPAARRNNGPPPRRPVTPPSGPPDGPPRAPGAPANAPVEATPPFGRRCTCRPDRAAAAAPVDALPGKGLRYA